MKYKFNSDDGANDQEIICSTKEEANQRRGESISNNFALKKIRRSLN